jgi:uncharacterized protein (TIGR02145 family)
MNGFNKIGVVTFLIVALLSACNSSTKDAGVIINGVKWATRNVDMPGTFAKKPEDAGMFYQWNRKIGYSAKDPMTNSKNDDSNGDDSPEGKEWENVNNPCPKGWRVPTKEEIEKLIDVDKVSHEFVTLNNINVKKFTDKANGNIIFMPVAGMRDLGYSGRNLSNVNRQGYYWSSTPYSEKGTSAYYLGLAPMNWLGQYLSREGRSVRCVAR